jgi:polar amino acid transport system substrate-binding protein
MLACGGRRKSASGTFWAWHGLLIWGCLTVTPAAVLAQDVKLATLDWPPYTSPTLPQKGMVSNILQDAAKQSGHDLGFGFFPWVRAMRTGRDDPNYVGYFPAYWTPERAQTCNFSKPIGIGEVGLVQRRDHPVHWSELQDLSNIIIGVTAGYSNGTAFDTMVRDGKLQVQPAPADIDNLRMVARGRIPVAVVERSVFEYSLLTEPDLRQKREELEFNPQLIAELPLYVCFKKTADGQHWKDVFDAGLAKVDLLAAQRSYLRMLIALQ